MSNLESKTAMNVSMLFQLRAVTWISRLIKYAFIQTIGHNFFAARLRLKTLNYPVSAEVHSNRYQVAIPYRPVIWIAGCWVLDVGADWTIFSAVAPQTIQSGPGGATVALTFSYSPPETNLSLKALASVMKSLTDKLCIGTNPLIFPAHILSSMNHEIIAVRVEHISMATGILAGLSAAGAVLAEPTGLDALGVWLGITDEPLIISAAPILGSLATASGTLSGFTYFWAQRKKRQVQNRTEDDNSTLPE